MEAKIQDGDVSWEITASCKDLVLNLRSGLVSLQYHVVFDDRFMTVESRVRNEIPDNWDKLFTYKRNYLEGEEEIALKIKLGEDWKDHWTRQSSKKKNAAFQKKNNESKDLELPPDGTPDLPGMTEDAKETSEMLDKNENTDDETCKKETWQHRYPTRSRRTLSVNKCVLGSNLLVEEEQVTAGYYTAFQNFINETISIMTAEDGTLLDLSPWAFISNNEDTLHFGDYLKCDDKG